MVYYVTVSNDSSRCRSRVRSHIHFSSSFDHMSYVVFYCYFRSSLLVSSMGALQLREANNSRELRYGLLI